MQRAAPAAGGTFRIGKGGLGPCGWRSADGGRELNESEAFVLTRAVLGALRAAVLEETPLLKTAAFEDALVRLILGFLNGPGVLMSGAASDR